MTSSRLVSSLALASSFLVACSAAPGTSDSDAGHAPSSKDAGHPAADAGKPATKDAGAADAAKSDSGARNAGDGSDAGDETDAALPDGSDEDASMAVDSGGAADGGSADSGHDSGTIDAGPATSAITSLTANQCGRSGGDLQLTIEGTDSNPSAYGAYVELADSTGAPVNGFDSNWDGTPDTSAQVVLFDDASAAGLTTFTRTVTLRGGLTAFPGIALVSASIVDSTGRMSPAMTASTIPQSVSIIGSSCDPANVTTRCAADTYCNATTSVCATGTAPSVTRFSYVQNAAGPEVLFLGTDPADDVSSLHVEFLNSSGNPAQVDLTGNGDYATSFDVNMAGQSSGGTFFTMEQFAQGFDALVPRLAVTPSSAGGAAGTRALTAIAAQQVAGAGLACDYRGFVGCGTGYVCSPGLPAATNTCVASGTARTAMNASATVLDPSKNLLFATGYAAGASLWDPPHGCVADGATGRPQGIVRLHLAQVTPALTITTANPETNFDSVLWLLPGTGASTGSPVGCNDDSQGYTSTIHVTNAAPGDYTIVIGSFSPKGGEFGVSVSLQ